MRSPPRSATDSAAAAAVPAWNSTEYKSNQEVKNAANPHPYAASKAADRLVARGLHCASAAPCSSVEEIIWPLNMYAPPHMLWCYHKEQRGALVEIMVLQYTHIFSKLSKLFKSCPKFCKVLLKNSLRGDFAFLRARFGHFGHFLVTTVSLYLFIYPLSLYLY